MIYSFIDEWLEVAEKHNATVKRILPGPSIIDRTYMQFEMVYMHIPYKYSHIIFSSGESDQIRIKYDFNLNSDFQFLIYQEDYMDKIGKFFDWVKEITINDPKFDQKFMIQTSNPEKMIRFLDTTVKSYLLSRYGTLANFKLETMHNSMVLTLNAPFDERNTEMMEKTIQFIKYAIDKIGNLNRY
jgi:hypothetical protein